MGSVDGSFGPCVGHQATIGESASSSGVTTARPWAASGPKRRSTTTSEAPASPPTRIWPSSRAAPRLWPATTTMMRQGCWRLASLAVSMAASASASSTTTRRVSTRESAIDPVSARSRTRRFATSAVVVLGRSTITGVPHQDRSGVPRSAWAERARDPRSAWASCLAWSRQPPRPSVTAHERVGAGRAPAAGGVLLGRRPLLLPEPHDGVEDLPGELDLLVPGEQGWLAEEHVEDEPLVRLGGGLGEGAPVAEVHGHVAHLHLRHGHLRPETQRHALVGLHPDDDRVLPELLGRGVREGEVGCPLEHHRDLGDPLAEPFAGSQ